MKQIVAAVFLILVIISLIVVAFTIRQVDVEQKSLKIDLQYRTTLLAETLKESIEPNFLSKTGTSLQKIVDKFENKERFAGLAIYNNKGNIIAVSSSLPKDVSKTQTIAAHAMDEDKANGDFVKYQDKRMYLFAVPLRDKESVLGALMLVQNADYIDDKLIEIWRNNLVRLFVQALLLSIATLIIMRWIIFQPIVNIVDSIKMTRTGRIDDTPKRFPKYLFFQPLVNEVAKINRSLLEARLVASEEARLRLEKTDSPWTAERLKEYIKEILKGRSIYVISNREPYIHTKDGNKVKYFVPASGMVTAIEPIMEACGGMWIAHGSGDADKLVVDTNDRIQVPPDEPKYTLRRVWITPEEEKGYYYGFSNEGLWPLCHIAHTRPVFRKEDWYEYEKVNGKFAKTVLGEIKNVHRPLIFIQDYHFALLPRMIKASRPDADIGIFWHIPWPNPEAFSICPWRKEILDGILGSDLIGFHTQYHCNNFMDTVGKELESLISWEQFAITKGGHVSYVKPFPISIAFSNGSMYKVDEKTRKHEETVIRKKHDIKTKYIGLGVDRLDYTKGILERFKAVEMFLETYPFYKNQFTFVQIAAPSRSDIIRYQEFAKEVEEEVERINDKFKIKDWKPIILLKRHHSHEEIYSYYRLANVCLVTSLHDGMNLVAKEFVSARDDGKGVLIVSQFAGVSRELRDAIIVNPYNAEQVAEAIKKSLEMPQSEQKRQMKKMDQTIKSYNIYRWSAEILKTMVSFV
ncbi:trehalose-6-phosphate synthase [Candidatus Gottesmanbacteria bacterium CG11_big_fil_rev_8_21_14_0_20_37_11]|uniref:Glucosylglycerol-phosphate synthase n=2 Tax=Candidatus Gottesmaniibacteriota TaxID=1752720 RepID=A0A2M7RRX5_9BACT|nr:MAG: trehalose-6-phosphate synthase [Candidatus Gottesmanbacteria bacterium CG23_combo_of_CG06-09_8_20_14_all_37_19]PIR07858.1 MAG: trehalose-6-phosphate synthase [Candidatus Gottesmanbacteria bacterium CG11_big_fil_rev_8_21_14_0_20_37_11]PIZ03042.1 MAG: trehalose-6-phosphate synthase [Candidatus Gottesmanbacteria bacterium CG_4_10_14_0_8_um_filter_37_24]